MICISKFRLCRTWSIVNFDGVFYKLLCLQSIPQFFDDFSIILIFLHSFIKRDKDLKTIFSTLYHVCIQVSFDIELKTVLPFEFNSNLQAFFVYLLLQRHHIRVDQPELICRSFLFSFEKWSYVDSASIAAPVSFELFKRVFSCFCFCICFFLPSFTLVEITFIVFITRDWGTGKWVNWFWISPISFWRWFIHRFIARFDCFQSVDWHQQIIIWVHCY